MLGRWLLDRLIILAVVAVAFVGFNLYLGDHAGAAVMACLAAVIVLLLTTIAFGLRTPD